MVKNNAKQPAKKAQPKAKARQPARKNPSNQLISTVTKLAESQRKYMREMKEAEFNPRKAPSSMPASVAACKLSPAASLALWTLTFPESAPRTLFPDDVNCARHRFSYIPQTVTIPLAAGAGAIWVRGDPIRSVQTYTDAAGTGSANVAYPESAWVATTFTSARCTGLCAKVRVRTAATARPGTMVVVPVRQASVDLAAVPASFDLAAAKTGAYTVSPGGNTICVRAFPANGSIFRKFEPTSTTRPVENLWGVYIAFDGWTAGDSVSVEIAQVYEGMPLIKSLDEDEHRSCADSERVLPLGSDRSKFPPARVVALAQS